MKASATIALAASLLALVPAAAQEWPSKSVKVVVPFGPGSTPDMVARLVADRLQQKLGQSFVIDNKPGASGNVGTDAVAKAEPDGATIGVSIGGPLAINTLLFSKLPYDPAKDIAPITQLITQPSALVVNNSLGVNSVAELVALLKRESGKYNFGSIGNGSLSHLAMEAIALRSGTKMVHIPYPGSPQAMTAVLRGDVQMACLPAIAVDAAARLGQGEGPGRLHRAALGIAAGHPDLEGSRHRRRSGRVDGPDCARQDAGCRHCQNPWRGGGSHQGARPPGQARDPIDGAGRQLAGRIPRRDRARDRALVASHQGDRSEGQLSPRFLRPAPRPIASDTAEASRMSDHRRAAAVDIDGGAGDV